MSRSREPFGRSRDREHAMSICATLWMLKFPREGNATLDCEWITVHAQAVPAHVGTPTPGHGYEGGDPYAGFLPPPVGVNAQGEAPHDREKR